MAAVINGLGFRGLHDALKQIEAAPSNNANNPPKITDIYAPAEHESALDPDRPLVVGGRGVGKSFWASALVGKETRALLGEVYPRLQLSRYSVTLGFGGVDTAEGGAPSQEVLDDLIKRDSFSPEIIWRAVILRALEQVLPNRLPTTWRGSNGLVAWADTDSERLQSTLRAADDALTAADKGVVVIFDALDRLGQNWSDIGVRTKALMRVALALRSYRAIKVKIFMRADQAEDQSLTAFPDASKLIGGKVDLVWERHDLYGLLFSLLLKNRASRVAFGQLLQEQLNISLPGSVVAQLPNDLRDERKQETIFTAIAGQYMGSDRRRGKTYSWLYNHLSDAFGRVSPRSFLEAIRVAAVRSNSETRVLDPKGLQAGLQSASKLRVDQLREEFGWIRSALEPLADLRVPCENTALFDRWQNAGTISAIRRSATTDGFLEPIEFESSSDGPALLEALRRIGVAEQRADKRVNVPDIYRVAAKLLRYGGVPPSK